jgi:hypothetical protein
MKKNPSYMQKQHIADLLKKIANYLEKFEDIHSVNLNNTIIGELNIDYYQTKKQQHINNYMLHT